MNKISLVLVGCLFSSPLFANDVQYSNKIELDSSTTQFSIVSANMNMLATKTETHDIPGCSTIGEAGQDCTRTTVLERKPVVEVVISYSNPNVLIEGNGGYTYTSMYLNPASFSQTEIDKLMSIYPSWKHPFSKVGRQFIKDNLSLSVVRAVREIKVVDTAKSSLCLPQGESSAPAPGCVEHLVYRTAKSYVNEVTVSVKH